MQHPRQRHVVDEGGRAGHLGRGVDPVRPRTHVGGSRPRRCLIITPRHGFHRLHERLVAHGIHTVQDVLARDAEELSNIPGIGPVTAKKLLDMAGRTLEESLADQQESVIGEE